MQNVRRTSWNARRTDVISHSRYAALANQHEGTKNHKAHKVYDYLEGRLRKIFFVSFVLLRVFVLKGLFCVT